MPTTGSDTAHFSGVRLRALREERRRRRELLAVQCDYSFPAIVNWERGVNIPSDRAQRALATALGVEISDFYDNTEAVG